MPLVSVCRQQVGHVDAVPAAINAVATPDLEHRLHCAIYIFQARIVKLMRVVQCFGLLQ